MNDFFFGEIEKNSLAMSHVCEVAEKVSAEFFTAQLNRLLQSNNGFINICDETSMPDFLSLLHAITAKDIGFIKIHAQFGDSHYPSHPLLRCRLVMQNGVVNVRAHWGAYKEERASDLFYSLLVPLHLKGLANKTYIQKGNEEVLLSPANDYYIELMNTYKLAQGMDFIEPKCHRCIKELELASGLSHQSGPASTLMNNFTYLCEKIK